MKKTSSEIKYRSRFNQVVCLALTLSFICSTTCAYAVFNAPPATSKGETEDSKKEDSKKKRKKKKRKKRTRKKDRKKRSKEENKTSAETTNTEAAEAESTKGETDEANAASESTKTDQGDPPVAETKTTDENQNSTTENKTIPESTGDLKPQKAVEESPIDTEKASPKKTIIPVDTSIPIQPIEVKKKNPAPTNQSDSTEKTTTEPQTSEESSDSSTTKLSTGDDSDTETTETEEEQQPVKKPEHISEADNFLLQNEFEKAEKAYRLLLEQDENGDAYAGLAVALAKQKGKKVIEAEQILRKGKEDFPNNPNMMAAAGFVALEHSKAVASPAKRDRYIEASEIMCERAILANPEMVIAQQTLGRARLAQDKPESAVRPFKICYKITEDKVNATLLAQTMLMISPRNAQAKELIDIALEEDEDYTPAKLQKAIYLTNTGKNEEAFTELHSISRSERESEWYRVQGDIYYKQGDGNSSVNSWKLSIQKNPRNPAPYKKLAKHYTLRGDGEFAIDQMHSALEILPNDIKLRQQLAELALRLNKLDVAEQEFRTILNVKPDDPSSLLGLARVFFRKARIEGQYPQGWIELKDKLQDVIERQSLSVTGQLTDKFKNMQVKVQLAEAEKALTQKQYRDARRLFGSVITNSKDNPFELLTLAEQAYNDGDLKSAELAYSYAREIQEVAPRAEQGMSKINSQRKEAKRQIRLGDATEKKLPDVAEDHYKQALIADPQNADAYYNLFILYLKERKNKTEKTIDYGSTFLEVSDDTDNRRKQVEKILFKLKERLRKEKSK